MQRDGGFTGIEKAAQLIAQAKRSVGNRTAVEEAKSDLRRLIEEYERVTSMLEEIETDIEALLSEIPMAQQLRTIKGLRKIFTAAILAGTGDLRQYARGRQVLRKAGLNLAESTSGKRKGRIILSKRGDSALRKYLYLATVQLVWNNPVFRHLHKHNVQERKMKKQQSIFKLMGKLLVY
ncbi:transposase [Paenibacillus mendelii]|uniref:Transposase n=1 Tax=Paenibacillus mendelii TaxID=206163 RepID=A0ABV6J6I1_9BACL|nr:transposase [Paenibacillus mendelii]MCQ6559914.1 transposase [Paenibacillus mendelii]